MKQKINELFRGKKPFRQRAAESVLPCLALTFTLFCFGPLDLVSVGQNFLPYTAFDLLKPVLLLLAAAFFGLWTVVSIPGGRIHALLLTFVSGCALACWLQGAFLNADLGVLDGHSIAWERYTVPALFNLLIWCLILLIPLLLHYFSRKAWKNCITLLSIALLLMQGISLGVKLSAQESQGTNLVLRTNEAMNLGKSDNILVFLLDTVSEDDLTKTAVAFPDILYPFRDFTNFDNCNSHYMFTFPAVPDLLTGHPFDCERESSRQYFENAWTSQSTSDFYAMLHLQGYVSEIYMNPAELTHDLSLIAGKFDNVADRLTDAALNRKVFLKLIKLSCYRYLPQIMKASFWIYTDDIVPMFAAEENDTDPWTLIQRFNREGIRLGNTEKKFAFYYLNGTHYPWLMEADGKTIYAYDSPDHTTREEQLAGHLNVLANYLWQMKHFGVYDDATIILLGDHGSNFSPDDDHRPFLMIKQPGETHNTMAVSHAPVTSQEQFLPTVARFAGGNSADFGQTFYEIRENAEIERYVRDFDVDAAYADLGRFNIMKEYRYSGDSEALNARIADEDFTVHPLIDSFY